MRKEIYLIIYNIRSALNVGSMFRTADAFGVSKIYVCGYSPDPTHEKVAKTALGAEKSVNWEHQAQTWRLLGKLKSQGIRIVALEQSNKSVNLAEYHNSDDKLALIVGNEVNGLSPKILELCDDIVEIPMLGEKESLNVSVAAGIALFAIKNPTRG